jgi:tetratricopeptide (TPR) repeat protein
LTHRALAILSVGIFSAGADEAASARESVACDDLRCLQELHASECSGAASTIETCLVFLQRLETARRKSNFTGLVLLLGDTLRDVARKDVSPRAQERYLERSRAAYREVVKNEPFNASGYLGLAEVAEPGEERVAWLRGAVQAEFRPVHMELLAKALSDEVGGHTADLEAAGVIEAAYTFESTDAEKWRYGASALQRYSEALERYPSAVTERSLENVVLRVKEDVDYPLLQRMLLHPESYLPYLGDAFAAMCEKSIAAIVSLDECMAGLELAVAMTESSASAGDRRLLAEATLTGMRTIAGEELPRSMEARRRFLDWIDRLLRTELTPVEVPANLLEAQADYTADLVERAAALLSATELSPHRGDLRLKLGDTYVDLGFWLEALEQLRIAAILLPAEDHERVARLAETADKRYQARFLPPSVTE